METLESVTTKFATRLLNLTDEQIEEQFDEIQSFIDASEFKDELNNIYKIRVAKLAIIWLNETNGWNDEILTLLNGRQTFQAYITDLSELTNLCEYTPSLYLRPLSGVVQYTGGDLDEEVYEKVEEGMREAEEGTYIHFSQLDKFPHEIVDMGSKARDMDDNTYDEFMDEWDEHFRCNHPYNPNL